MVEQETANDERILTRYLGLPVRKVMGIVLKIGFVVFIESIYYALYTRVNLQTYKPTKSSCD